MSVFLARVMGAERLGHYSLALAAISLVGIPIQMGLPSLVLRETARSLAVRDWPLMRGIWLWATRRVLLFSGVMAVVAVSAVLVIPTLVQPEARPVFLVGLPLLPLIALSQVRSAALRGLGRVVPSQFPDTILRPGLLMLLTSAAYLATGPQLSATVVMSIHVLAASLAFLVGVALLFRFRPKELISEKVRQVNAKGWRAAVWPLALITGAQSVTANADLLMLGWWRDAVEIGHYKVATSASNVSIIGLSIVAMVCEQRYAVHFRLGETGRLARLASGVALIGFVLAVPLILMLVAFGGVILRIFFGSGFEQGGVALTILVLGQLVNAFCGSSISLLNMSGHERIAMRGIGLAAVFNVLLNLLLIPGFGIEGAAAATAVSTILWNVLLWHGVKTRLGIDCSPLGLFSGRQEEGK
nr:polysaccharide biosynthesis C-terminal domain-containing protein [Thalassovita sp.]